MKEYKTLRLLDRFHGLFERMGINYRVMRKILQCSLTMDGRRTPTAVMNRQNQKEGKNSFLSTLLVYGLIGLFSAVVIIFPYPVFIKFTVSIGIILFMIMTTMISDFSTVLLDTREKNILQPRPVDSKTLNAAKLIHIVIYLLSITGAIAGPSLIAVLILYGPVFFLIFAVELILVCGFVIFFTSMLYSLILVFFDGEKLKDIINYFQIALSVFLLLFYQLAGRMFNFTQLKITVVPAWWHYLIPSAWFAAPFSLLSDRNFSPYYLSLTALALVVPIVTFTVYVKFVVPRFERNLQKLNNNGGRQSKAALAKAGRRRRTAALLCPNSTEHVFFRFTQSMVSNERKLKLRLYPNLAFAAVMPFIFMFGILSSAGSVGGALSSLSGSRYYFGLYFTVAMLTGCIVMLSTSESYKGAWIYKALPLETPVPILKGAFKGFMLRFIVPLYMVVGVVFAVLFGVRIIPDIILIFVNMLILMLFIYKTSKRQLPFYRDFQYTQDGSYTGTVILSLVLTGGLALLHLVLTFVPFGVYGNLVLSLLAAFLLWRACFKVTWGEIARDAM